MPGRARRAPGAVGYVQHQLSSFYGCQLSSVHNLVICTPDQSRDGCFSGLGSRVSVLVVARVQGRMFVLVWMGDGIVRLSRSDGRYTDRGRRKS